jgi:hypothetical protein
MDIIRATEEHLPLILPLFDAYRQFYEQPSDPKASSLYLAERLANQESAIFLACEQKDGKKMGIGFTQLYLTFSSVALKKFWVLHDLVCARRFSQNGGCQKIDRK